MREIKFRGKRVDNGEWVYGSLTICNAFDLKDGTHKSEPLHAFICKQNIEWLSNPDDKRWTFPSYEVIPETVGQNTGLKDNKRTKEYPEGQEIYGSIPINGKMSKGGDIVKIIGYCNRGDPSFGEIVYDDDVACFAVHTKWNHRFFYELCENHTVEVIGNAAENPELLEK